MECLCHKPISAVGDSENLAVRMAQFIELLSEIFVVALRTFGQGMSRHPQNTGDEVARDSTH